MKNAPDWILVGTVGRPHGTGGELLVHSLTDHEERFDAGSELFLGREGSDGKQRVKIVAGRRVQKGVLVRLEGYDTREQARELSGSLLFISAQDINPPDPGTFYGFQLEGCAVFAGVKKVGVVINLHESKANPCLEVEPDAGGQEILVPFVKAVILSVDIEARRIEIQEDFLG